MNKKLVINKNQSENVYDISLNTDFEGIREYLCNILPKKYAKICIVSDSRVAEYHLDELGKIVSKCCDKTIAHVFPAGESSKNQNTLGKLYEDLINNHFDRKDLLIALGGGVVGDLCGYCAATYLRGIDYIQIPTTLLAQVDSSIGGKTAIDYMQYKNMVGAFYMPKLVYINVNTLRTLDEAVFCSGMGEIIKHGLIQDKEYYEWIKANRDAIMARDEAALIELIYKSCTIKGNVVEIDPKEHGIRAYLNFGHTIGHAIEKLCNYKLYHGECVAIGMVSSLYISCKRGYISQEEVDDAIKLIESFNLPTAYKKGEFSPEDVLAATKNDKKMENNTIKFVVLKDIGNAEIVRDVDDDLILEAVNEVLI